ncbi:MAG: type II toxin-antitoxin system VapC family toxin [Prochloron sp. SP5CPC1]|nr:type II toxin-antitoxin system VapC family toxin [Candidatus Paraprochloron terpiosi SP5CPC1]
MLLDSNIIIYAARPENSELRRFIAECTPAVSALSYVEVLGYHRLSESDRPYFEEFFGATRILAISQAVLNQAVVLRQMRKMTLGDSIIAGTALVYNLTLVTRNIEDFRWITQLTLLNPFEDN